MNDPAVWLAYARAALGGALKGAELEAEVERLRYNDQPRLELEPAERRAEQDPTARWAEQEDKSWTSTT